MRLLPQATDREVELLVSETNGEFTQPGWVPVHYIHRNLGREELLAYYRAADIALVTPLKDSRVTPNHLTTVRLGVGLAAASGFGWSFSSSGAVGTFSGVYTGGDNDPVDPVAVLHVHEEQHDQRRLRDRDGQHDDVVHRAQVDDDLHPPQVVGHARHTVAAVTRVSTRLAARAATADGLPSA